VTLLRRNWRRNVVIVLLFLEGTFIIAVIFQQMWLALLLALVYGCLLVPLVYGDFLKGAFDTMHLESENEVLNATNARLNQMIEEYISGSNA